MKTKLEIYTAGMLYQSALYGDIPMTQEIIDNYEESMAELRQAMYQDKYTVKLGDNNETK